MMHIEVITEFVSLVLGFVAIIYIFGITKLVNHGLGVIWKLILLSYTFFILAELTRILDILGLINAKDYKAIGGVLFIAFFTIAIIKFNRQLRCICDNKNKKKGRLVK